MEAKGRRVAHHRSLSGIAASRGGFPSSEREGVDFPPAYSTSNIRRVVRLSPALSE